MAELGFLLGRVAVVEDEEGVVGGEGDEFGVGDAEGGGGGADGKGLEGLEAAVGAEDFPVDGLAGAVGQAVAVADDRVDGLSDLLFEAERVSDGCCWAAGLCGHFVGCDDDEAAAPRRDEEVVPDLAGLADLAGLSVVPFRQAHDPVAFGSQAWDADQGRVILVGWPPHVFPRVGVDKRQGWAARPVHCGDEALCELTVDELVGRAIHRDAPMNWAGLLVHLGEQQP